MSYAQVYPIEALTHIRPTFSFEDDDDGEAVVVAVEEVRNEEDLVNNEFDQQVNANNLQLVPKISFYVNDQEFRLEEDPVIYDLSDRPQYLSKIMNIFLKNLIFFFLICRKMNSSYFCFQ
jgi:hypothetical protein